MTQQTVWNTAPPGVKLPPTRVLYPMPWVFAGRVCTAAEFADNIWPEDCADKTAFLLRWQGFQIFP